MEVLAVAGEFGFGDAGGILGLLALTLMLVDRILRHRGNPTERANLALISELKEQRRSLDGRYDRLLGQMDDLTQVVKDLSESARQEG